MTQQWRMTPPILPIELKLPSQQNKHLQQMEEINNNLNYQREELTTERIEKKSNREFKKKNQTIQVVNATSNKNKVVKQKTKNGFLNNQKAHLQVKNIHKFMKKIDNMDQALLLTKQLKLNSKQKKKYPLGHSKNTKSQIQPVSINLQQKKNKDKRSYTHRRGYSEVVRKQKDELTKKEQHFFMGGCISGVTSLASLDYPKNRSKQLYLDHGMYCMTDELPRKIKLDLQQPDELALKISLDFNEIKEFFTTNPSQREDTEDNTSEKSTKNIINRYICNHQFRQKNILFCQNQRIEKLSDVSKISSIQKSINLELQKSPLFPLNIQFQKSNQLSQSVVWRKKVLQKVENMLGEIDHIPLPSQSENKNKEIKHYKSSSKAQDNQIISQCSVFHKNQDRWVDELTKQIQIINLDKFLKDRMVELFQTDNMIETEERLSNMKLQKWVKCELNRIRKARYLLNDGLKKASALLSKDFSIINKNTLKNSKKNSISLQNLRSNYLFQQKKTSSQLLRPQQQPKLTLKASQSGSLSPWQDQQSKQFGRDDSSFISTQTKQLKKVRQFEKISPESGEQLLQIVFLQLCLEFIEQMEQNQDNQTLAKCFIILRSIFGVGFDRNNSQNNQFQRNKRKGFGSTPKDVTTFLVFFMKNLLSEEKIEDVKNYMLKGLSEPVGPGVNELLKYMRNSGGDLQSEPSEMEEKTTFIFRLRWFQEISGYFVESYDFGQFFTDQIHERRRKDFLKSAMHIHNKAIFDCLNQIVDKFRPHGLLGQPYPWKPKVSARPIDEETIENTLKRVCEQVSLSSKFLCGLINDPNSPYQLSERQLLEIREDRMCKYLCHDVEQFENRWNFYDDEETELLITVCSSIQKELLGEVGSQILVLMKGNKYVD